MYDIIDFVMENSNEISNYEITYYDCDEDSMGEVEFTMKNGDKIIFQMC